jgi:hypothetical protein
MFAGMKKQKISAYHVFRKSVSKLFIAAQTFLISSIFDLYFLSQLSKFLRCLGVLERYFNRKYYKNNNNNFFFTWGHWKWNCPKTVFLIFFKLYKLLEDYHLLLLSKLLEGDFCCLENIDFWIWSNLKFSHILKVYFNQKNNTNKLQQQFLRLLFLHGLGRFDVK